MNMGGDRYSAGLFDDPKHDVHGPGITRTLYSAGIGAMAGTFYGACAAAWYPDSMSSRKAAVGFSDIRTIGRTLGRPAMWFSLAAGVFTATECAMEAARNEKRDAWNSLVAGMAGGGIVGSITGRPQVVAATAIGMGILMASVDLTGATTVYDEKENAFKRNAILPETHVESPTLAELKGKFPFCKDL